jgi:SAM-dependent methyltransferase
MGGGILRNSVFLLMDSYHGTEAPYPLPTSKDDKEKYRLDQLQFLSKAVLGGNVLVSLVQGPSHIGIWPSKWYLTELVDIGCGSGKWAIEMAEQYPTCEVVGLDLFQITRHAPANCKFVVGDLNKGLLFPDDTMDLVQSRYGD